jgi:hypothetical protein
MTVQHTQVLFGPNRMAVNEILIRVLWLLYVDKKFNRKQPVQYMEVLSTCVCVCFFLYRFRGNGVLGM